MRTLSIKDSNHTARIGVNANSQPILPFSNEMCEIPTGTALRSF